MENKPVTATPNQLELLRHAISDIIKEPVPLDMFGKVLMIISGEDQDDFEDDDNISECIEEPYHQHI